MRAPSPEANLLFLIDVCEGRGPITDSEPKMIKIRTYVDIEKMVRRMFVTNL